MPSESVTETVVLAGQLNAFAEAQRLRDDVKARDLQIADLEKQVADLKRQLSGDTILERPMLQCLCCDADMAPAKAYVNGQWEWEDGDKASCDNCGWEGEVSADSNGRRAEMIEIQTEDIEVADEFEEEEF